MNYFTTETDSGYQIKIPFTFRGYRVKKPCGKGVFASVVIVIDVDTKKQYAAKIIPKKVLQNQSLAQTMINNEIEILQKVNHPNIIELYEIIDLTTKDDSFVVLIEEFCPNGDLLNYTLKNGLKNDQERRQISRGITEAVCHLHDLGIAHCDIKPENVLLDDKKNPKLCDFNLSKIIEKVNNSERGGSKPYAAPELFKFGRFDFLKADIWSLGITIFAISEMRYPYNDVDDAQRGLLVFNSKSGKLNAFTKRCLKVNPSKRPSANDLLNDPYLTFDGDSDNSESDINDDKMIAKKKKESVKKMKTSPNLADAKKSKKSDVISDDDHLPSIHENDDDDDSQLNDDVFEMIYGYRRSSAIFNASKADEDDEHTEVTVYKKQKSSSEQTDSNNRHSLINESSSQNDTNSNDNNDNDFDDDDDAYDNRVEIQSGSFAFSVMLELGYDYELQNRSESSQADYLSEDEIEAIKSDDFDDFEIERIENRICDSIVKVKYEKKRKMKKKVSYLKKKGKRD